MSKFGFGPDCNSMCVDCVFGGNRCLAGNGADDFIPKEIAKHKYKLTLNDKYVPIEDDFSDRHKNSMKLGQ